MKLKVFFAWVLAGMLFLMLLVFFVGIGNRVLLKNYGRASDNKALLLSLSNELQQSSDNLSEAVQNYVGTADARWLSMYNDVLAVRNGSAPRPDGRTASLRSLLAEAGCTREELALLQQAEDESNRLAQIERKAFELIKTAQVQKDTISKQAQLDSAREMIFGNLYHDAKRGISEPIQKFQQLMASRVEQAVGKSEKRVSLASLTVMVAMAMSMIGILLAAFAVNKKVLKPLGADPQDMQALAHDIASGKLRTYDLAQYDNSNVAGSLAIMSQKLHDIISEVQSLNDKLWGSSEQMESVAMQIADTSSEQASSAEEISSTVEEIVSTVHTAADNAREARQVTGTSVQSVEGNLESARAAQQAATDIEQHIMYIGEIAQQTNILALNAAVEAARAGEHGRGFAVVASEVRKLADASRVTAEKIVSLSQACTQATTQAAEKSQQVVLEMRRNIELIDEIATSQDELSRGADGINIAIQRLSSIVQLSAGTSEELASTSSEVKQSIGKLNEEIGFFKS